jgi:hypothetical protein
MKFYFSVQEITFFPSLYLTRHFLNHPKSISSDDFLFYRLFFRVKSEERKVKSYSLIVQFTFIISKVLGTKFHFYPNVYQDLTILF